MAKTSITARELVHDLLPKLTTAERYVNNALEERAGRVESEGMRVTRQNQQAEFELEIAMIRMNLDHLLKRYAGEIDSALATGGSGDSLLPLDQHEGFAIASIRKLYGKVRATQA